MFQCVAAEEIVSGGIDRPVAELSEFGECVQSEHVEQIPSKRETSLIHKQNRRDGKECDNLQPEIKPQIVHKVPIDNAERSEQHRRNKNILF